MRGGVEYTPPSSVSRPDSKDDLTFPIKRQLEEAMWSSFTALDVAYLRSLSTLKRQTGCRPNGPWNVGSCALVCAVYTPEGGKGPTRVVTAHSGDCRAVITSSAPPPAKYSSGSKAVENLSQVEDDLSLPGGVGEKRKRSPSSSSSSSSSSSTGSPSGSPR